MHVRPSRWFVFLLLGASGAASLAQTRQPLSYDQIFRGGEPRLTVSLPSVTGWADDHRYLIQKKNEGDEHARVYAVDAESGAETVHRDLHAFKDLVEPGIDPATPASATGDFSIMVYQKNGDLYLLDAASRKFRRLTSTPGEEKNPHLSPTGASVAFTRNADLFTIDIGTGKEIRHTTDGSDVVLNGWASWVYYEEILGRSSRYKAFWWSPDGSRLAYFRFDDSPVPLFPIYGAAGKRGFLEQARYPKAGDPNPHVMIGVVPAGGGATVWADFEPHADQYFGTPFWSPDGKQLLVQWMNRGQDSLILYAIDPLSGHKRQVYLEQQETWVDWLTSVHFLKDGRSILLKSDRDGWSHLYVCGLDGGSPRQLTEGPWEVVDLLTVNENSGLVYFTGRREASTRTDLYSIRLDGLELNRLTFGRYTHAVRLSSGGSYFVTTYSNVTTPPRMALVRSGGKLLRELADAKTPDFDRHEIAPTELFTIPGVDGYNLPASWVLPTQFERGKKYPVLISVYGGPGSAAVADRWGGLQDQWLAREGLITMSVDNRGSGHFGKRGVNLMHRRLGHWEMVDLIEAVKWLRRQPFVDSTRIAITGGSYGGYVTCLALTAGAGYFTHGIALFSVTDWELYDSHYAERYMDSPDENRDGYREASVLSHADKYKGLLRIVHGTMDDNVHLQNSLQLVEKLQNLNRHFELMVYPGERHGWGGAKAAHLRKETYRFYYAHLLQKPFPDELFSSPVRGGERTRRRE